MNPTSKFSPWISVNQTFMVSCALAQARLVTQRVPASPILSPRCSRDAQGALTEVRRCWFKGGKVKSAPGFRSLESVYSSSDEDCTNLYESVWICMNLRGKLKRKEIFEFQKCLCNISQCEWHELLWMCYCECAGITGGFSPNSSTVEQDTCELDLTGLTELV